MFKKIYKKFGQKINTKNFFTSKNKLLQSKFNKTYINKLKKPLYQKASLEIINKSFNKYSSSLSFNIAKVLILNKIWYYNHQNEVLIPMK